MTTNTKEVIILGASYAGVLALKTLLSRKNPSEISINVKIISPNDHTYVNIASPRLLTEPEKIQQVLFSLQKLIDRLTANTIHKVEYIQGSVKEVDLDERKVYLHKSDMVFYYDNLIVATGTRMDSAVFKLDNIRDHNYTIQELNKLVENIKEAESIAVIGAGITGVEVVGELASNYSKTKSIDLYTGAEYPLPELRESHRIAAAERLTNFGVNIINNERVGVNKDMKSVILNDGTTKQYSLIIPAFRNFPNTEFLPKQVLNDSGYVYTDKHLRLEQYHNVFCLGDIIEMGAGSCIDLMFSQKEVFESVVDFEIFEQKSVQLKEHKKSETGYRYVIPLGKDGGIGAAYGFSLPNFIVRLSKAKDYYIPRGKDFFT
ncbi:uncharacterized protein J8A68_003345 [[Candida] subhashii]|uniref:FAD/NAD(P)-binding domain-containing protein n=1 Tax=[Candida] subhashii TaxID=561895 RepID=A0A8J5UML3_9ASCO|nr:uncharacterized protein J8A68_003345 [[Candida] subhashii]KAG7663167.1 hypothetical protein J8A68_003345 [[Candida] subhashii]